MQIKKSWITYWTPDEAYFFLFDLIKFFIYLFSFLLNQNFFFISITLCVSFKTASLSEL